MIWVCIFPLLGAIFGWKIFEYAKDTSWSFSSYVASTLLAAIFAFCGFVAGASLGTQMGTGHPAHWKLEETAALVSLRSSSGVTGNFFLGSGTIGQGQYYFFYEKLGEGYQPGSIAAANNVTIFEEKREDGELKTYVSSGFANPWIALIGLSSQSRPYAFSLLKLNKLYEFRIPEGSLKQNFVLQ